MVEIIKRRFEKEVIKVPEEFDEFQVSYNNWGHITLRWFKEKDQDNDFVVVLSERESSTLIRFIGNLFRGHDP